MVTLLSDKAASELRGLPLSYGEVGATNSELPSGYGHLEHSTTLPLQAFDAAAELLMTWQVQERSGLRVSPSDERVAENGVVEMFLGPRWLGIRAICRVVYVIAEPDRVGFGYGTLPGHAESGEESFVLERRDGATYFIVRAFSRPATLLSRLGGPISRLVQTRMTHRYLRAIRPDSDA